MMPLFTTSELSFFPERITKKSYLKSVFLRAVQDLFQGKTPAFPSTPLNQRVYCLLSYITLPISLSSNILHRQLKNILHRRHLQSFSSGDLSSLKQAHLRFLYALKEFVEGVFLGKSSCLSGVTQGRSPQARMTGRARDPM